MDEQRKFHRTVIEVEVLSEYPYGNADDLGNVHYDITDGDCSGMVRIVRTDELTGPQAAVALLAQGSDPGFFGLDELTDQEIQSAEQPEATVTVTVAELETLRRDQAILNTLQNWGVDNWDAYDDAMRELRGQD